MPKDIIVIKKDGRTFRNHPGRKLKIGGRKGGKSAHSMSTADLNAVLVNASQKRYHQNARTVLAARGVAV